MEIKETMHLWCGDGIKGDKYFWIEAGWEPRHRDYEHSIFCPCMNNGHRVEWMYDERDNYVPYAISINSESKIWKP